jgi:hypothetical protein
VSQIQVNQINDASGGVLAPISSVMRNRIINGAMVIDQRRAGASVTIPAALTYTLDRWQAQSDQASKYSVQQDAGAVTRPSGFTDYLGATSLSAYSVLTGDRFVIRQAIEGFNVADLGFGTANAKTITISFWVRSSLTGSFGGYIGNSALDRTYPFSYTISAANTWEQKSVTIAGDTSGTWLTNNGVGLRLGFSLGVGATYTGTGGAWASSQILAPTGSTSVVGTNGATLYITGVQLEVGTQATSFEYRQYQQELALCQRYYQLNGASGGWSQTATSIGAIAIALAPEMRAAPTVALLNGTGALVDPTLAFRDLSGVTTFSAATKNGGYIDATSSSTTVSKLQVVKPSVLAFSAEL